MLKCMVRYPLIFGLESGGCNSVVEELEVLSLGMWAYIQGCSYWTPLFDLVLLSVQEPAGTLPPRIRSSDIS